MYTKFVRPLLFRLDPEKAHHFAAKLGEFACTVPGSGYLMRRRYSGAWPVLDRQLMGIRFPNPVGIAAGFDKNASWPRLIRALGFGFAEFGSITARKSAGNPSPRLFRLPEDRALINRMGLNNNGAETICRHISELRRQYVSLFRDFPCGINIAKTHDPSITGDEAVRDYVASYGYARKVADYITLNISCPNTAEGITFEDKSALTDLLDGILSARSDDDPPLLIKFSPDTEFGQLDELTSVCEERNIHGYVLTNTSSRRDGLHISGITLTKIGPGGLSGSPLFEKSLNRVNHMRKALSGDKVLVGCGGIDSPDKAARMVQAGADLLQVYTGLIYEGPGLIPGINDMLTNLISANNPDTGKRNPK